MKKLVLIIAILLLTSTNVSSSGILYHSDGPYKGKVIDMETGEPIEGAVVAGLWYLEFTIRNPFCDAKETLTDKKGEFILPRASCFTFWPLARMSGEVVVYKPGYLGYPPLGATPEERNARMSGLTGKEFRDKTHYNIIKLGKPKTRQETEFTLAHAEGQFLFDECYEKLPILLKMINEEGRTLGLGEIGRPEK